MRTQTHSSDSETQWVIVCTPKFYDCGDSGPLRPARFVFKYDGTYVFQVLLIAMKPGMWRNSTQIDEITNNLDMLLANSGYLLCPGIANYETTFGHHVRFQPKNLRVWNVPQK